METHLNGSFARIYDCSMRDLQQFTHNSSLAKKKCPATRKWRGKVAKATHHYYKYFIKF